MTVQQKEPNMKTILLAIVTFASMAFGATIATATEKECPKQGGGYMCPGNIYIDSSAAADGGDAWAKAEQKQQQGQQQGQTSENTNTNQNVNGGNSVNIEGNPAHTTSIGLGVGVNFDIPVNKGYVDQRREAWADWYLRNGDSCSAFAIADDSRFMRKFKITRNCGDKG